MKQLLTLVLASLILPAVGSAQDVRAPELPSIRELRERAAQAAAPKACPAPALAGATIGRGAFADDYKVERDGRKLGVISSEGDGYVFKDEAGQLVAKAEPKINVAGQRYYDVTDCAGQRFAYVVEYEKSDSCSAFSIKTAGGVVQGRTPCTDSSSYDLVMNGASVARVKGEGFFSDRFLLASIDPSVEPRALALLVVVDNAAGYDRARERNRDRMGEGPRGHFKE